MDVLRAGLPDVPHSPQTVSLRAERALGRGFRGRHCREKAGPRRRDFPGFRREGLRQGKWRSVCGGQRNCFRL